MPRLPAARGGFPSEILGDIARTTFVRPWGFERVAPENLEKMHGREPIPARFGDCPDI